MSVQVNKKHMDVNSLKLYKPLKIKELCFEKMCFWFINLGISLSWFLNSFILERHYNYLLNLKTSENRQHASVRTKRLVCEPNGSGSLTASENAWKSPFLPPLANNTVVTVGERGVHFQLATAVLCDVLFPA